MNYKLYKRGRNLLAGLGGLLWIFAGAGCNTVSTHDLGLKEQPWPLGAPEAICVRDFDITDVDMQTGLTDEAAAAVRKDVTKKLTAELGTALANSGVAPRIATEEEGWLVTGRIRVMVLADAQTAALNPQSVKNNRIETTVFIYDLKQSRSQPFYTFRVTGKKTDDEKTNPVLETVPGENDVPLSAECRATAQLVADTLKNYLKERGLNNN